MCEQEGSGVMLKLVHFREAMQLDPSHVTCELVQNTCRNGLQFEISIFASRHTVKIIKHILFLLCESGNSILTFVVSSFNDIFIK